MRIVDLSHNDRYIALSYPWGKAEQLKLTHKTLNFFRTPRSLSQVFRQLPHTIQDAITLVQKVGERYLWLDCLCILQDDESDIRQQMEQMGTLYRHAYFTIFAISGHDANYGLPGVRPAPRRCKQEVVKIGDLSVANMLPWMEEEDLLRAGAWGSRGWTFQERFRAQRGVFIGDQGVIINCTHTYSPEDEHCFHKITRNEDMIAEGDKFFYAGQDKRCEPYIRHDTPFDIFTTLVSEYTQRHLTYQTDALAAFLGVQDTLESRLGCKLTHGLPEGEFEAALLWSQVGSSIRRCDPVTNKPLFPSWSWLGWLGHAAWPWQMERNTFISTVNSTLVWQDAATAAQTDRSSPRTGPYEFEKLLESLNEKGISVASHWSAPDTWFTSDDLSLPNLQARERVLQHWRMIYADHLGVRNLCNACRKHPNYANRPAYHWAPGQTPKWKYTLSGSHRLSFRTMCAYLYLVGRPFQRKRLFNMQHPIWRIAVVDAEEKLAGYIDVPDPSAGGRQIEPGPREFVVLSRSTVDGNYEPGPDVLEERRLKPLMMSQSRPEPTFMRTAELRERFLPICNILNAQGGFDAEIYDEDRPWCMFNVMMISRVGGVAYRDAIGRIHVDAILASIPFGNVIDLE